MNTVTSDLKHDNLRTQLYSKISLNTRTGCEKKSTKTNGSNILNSNQRFKLRYCDTSLMGCPGTPDKNSYHSLHFGYPDQPHLTRKNFTFTASTKVPDREAGFKVHRPLGLFPASRRHASGRFYGILGVFDFHDRFSLSKERVNQKTSEDLGFNDCLLPLKGSQKFRHPAVISLSAATVTDITAGAGSFGQEEKEGSQEVMKLRSQEKKKK